jgi:predicted transcriptional regulator
VLVNAHPVKNAKQDNLVPVGGGAFLNEVDGNLTLWSNSEKQATLHWQGKFRGPEFDPLAFEMETVSSDKVIDAKGRLMPSVVAKPVGELAVERNEAKAESDENQVLKIIAASPQASLGAIANRVGFSKAKVQRIIHRLKLDKMVTNHRGSKYRTTKKGDKAIGVKRRSEDDDDD